MILFSPPPAMESAAEIAAPPGVGGVASSMIEVVDKTRFRSIILIMAGSFLVVSFLGFSIWIIFRLKFRRRRRFLVAEEPPDLEIGDGEVFRDLRLGISAEEPYHVWCIKTAGLEQSAIEAIAVVPYQTGVDRIDCSDCAVCLGEFVKGDMLRVLPDCLHGFHVDCIDTWLRSHVNCPLCRSPIIGPEGRSPVDDPGDRVLGEVEQPSDLGVSSSGEH
ncbi:E3 ubiquitin-protein ligase RING1-like [Wolffia australiana]